jgi:hypothetical protein
VNGKIDCLPAALVASFVFSIPEHGDHPVDQGALDPIQAPGSVSLRVNVPWLDL